MNVNKACNWMLIAMSVLAFNTHADEPRPEKAYSIGLHMNERLFSDFEQFKRMRSQDNVARAHRIKDMFTSHKLDKTS